MKTILAIIVSLIISGCSTIADKRIVGTFVSDKETTISYLRTTGKFTEKQLQLLSSIMGLWKIECDGKYVSGTLGNETYGRVPFHILEQTSQYLVIEVNLNGESSKSKLIFAEDGYWLESDSVPPYFREKFTRIKPSSSEAK